MTKRSYQTTKNPYETASFLQRIFFTWVTPIIVYGYRNPLEEHDVPPIPDQFSCRVSLAQFKIAWEKEKATNKKKPNVGTALYKAFQSDLIFGFAAFIPFVGIMLLQPYLVNDFLRYTSQDNGKQYLNINSGIGLALFLGFLSIVNGISQNIAFYGISKSGLSMKAAIVSAIFEKSLKLSSASRVVHTTGEIVTMISADAERVWQAILYINWIWAGPIMVATAMILLIVETGYSAVAALGSMLLISYLQGYVGNLVGSVRKQQLKFTDERTKVINESLQGIRILKFYAWEEATSNRIEYLRQQEFVCLQKYQYLKMFNSIMMFIGPLIVSFVQFIVYIYLNGEMTIPKVYLIYALLNVIRLPFALTPIAWASLNESMTSFERLTKFLLLEEIEDVQLLTYDKSLSLEAKTNSHDNSLLSYSDHHSPTSPASNVLIHMNEASFVWDPKATLPILHKLTFSIHQGDFIAIVGSVGAGKSSLISAILGQMILQSGHVQGIGSFRVAYVAQEHWIQNCNLQQNILFDSNYQEKKYQTSIDKAQLTPDLLILPHADYTSIGERGLNLSGGQKARVSVARALYAGYNLPSHYQQIETDSSDMELNDPESAISDIQANSSPIEMFIFDDSLASVDVHVGKSLFEHAINSPHIQDKCRLVILSSNYHYLPKFPKILVLEKGSMVAFGSYSEIISKYPEYGTGQNHHGHHDHTNAKDIINNSEQKACDSISSNSHSSDSDSLNPLESEQYVIDEVMQEIEKDAHYLEHKHDPVDKHQIIQYKDHIDVIENKRKSSLALISAEDREKGAVPLSTYALYFSFSLPSYARPTSDGQNNSFGWFIVVSLLILFTLCQVARVFADLWLGVWAGEHDNNHLLHSRQFFITWFVLLTWVTVLLTVLRSYFFIITCLGASKNLHQILLQSILKAPINHYFDITPIGRILNRFTKDLDALDALLPDTCLQTLQNIFAVIAIFIVCIISSAYFILLFFPLGIGFYIIQDYFRKSSREMKRLDSISRSPVYSLFGEVLQGMQTIRAYDRTKIFTEKFFALVDRQSGNWFLFWMSSRWLAMRLDLISNLIVLAVSILAAILTETNSPMDPNLLGIALVYSLQLTALLQWTVRISIDTETNMTSVERLFYFSHIEPELSVSKDVHTQYVKVYTAKSNKPTGEISLNTLTNDIEAPNNLVKNKEIHGYSESQLRNWPSSGQIVFENVKLRYRPGLPLVLNGVNLQIPGGKKVACVGRTGSGKSTMMLALFRIVEPELHSKILIDGLDIQSIDLNTLRSRVTIIPQDPFLFSGTLRDNLDPFVTYSDEQIWEALARVHLKEEIYEKYPVELLAHQVTERGENISLGQRQLLCIARALLRDSKIIVMDEATASVDTITDNKIQTTIRNEFAHCTVLTIAHRLETIADYDLIVVMDQGSVVEIGSPLELLSSVDQETTKEVLLAEETKNTTNGFPEILHQEINEVVEEIEESEKTEEGEDVSLIVSSHHVFLRSDSSSSSSSLEKPIQSKPSASPTPLNHTLVNHGLFRSLVDGLGPERKEMFLSIAQKKHLLTKP